MKLTISQLRRLIQSILSARPQSIDCEACFDQLDHFAEMQLAGKPADQALPLIQAHLDACSDCREEYQALLDALQEEAL